MGFLPVFKNDVGICGGRREGAMLSATLFENVSSDQKLYRKEALVT